MQNKKRPSRKKSSQDVRLFIRVKAARSTGFRPAPNICDRQNPARNGGSADTSEKKQESFSAATVPYKCIDTVARTAAPPHRRAAARIVDIVGSGEIRNSRRARLCDSGGAGFACNAAPPEFAAQSVAQVMAIVRANMHIADGNAVFSKAYRSCIPGESAYFV